MGTSDLTNAKNAKKDEFYTRLTDIEKEMRHYRKYFKDKVVFCNCDDPFESDFFKYFVLNFNVLGLKRLIATCYDGSPIAGKQLKLSQFLGINDSDDDSKEADETPKPFKTPYKAVVNVVYDKNEDHEINMDDIKELFISGENTLCELMGNGDFRSKECLELMDESDIIVTNPPFSLFREYMATLMEHEKHFIIIGSINALTYREIFPLFMENRVWFGPSIHSGDRAFYVPEDYPLNAAGCGVDEDGRRFIKVKGIRWYTNLDVKERHEEIPLIRHYNAIDYPTYVNYDAIEVSKTQDIPCDYSGLMGVPITFIDKYNPDQFEILGFSRQLAHKMEDCVEPDAKYEQGGLRFYLKTGEKEYKCMYERIVIRNKNPEQPKEVSNENRTAQCNDKGCDRGLLQ